MATACLTAILTFISTNIDDIFVLMILFLQAQHTQERLQIVAGQYFGIGLLVVLSILGALGTQIFPPQYIGLLGFLPLLLGIRSWITGRREKQEQTPPVGNRIGFFSVVLLTIANGADNIGVYIPVFSSYTATDFAITLLIFAGMIALWCYLGAALANAPYIKKRIIRYQHIAVPFVFIALGLMILTKNYIL